MLVYYTNTDLYDERMSNLRAIHGESVWILNGLYENTALNLAVEYGHENIVKILLEYKASVDAILEYNSRTALHTAIVRNYQDTVEVLILNKASINYSSLFSTIILCREDILEMLINPL